MKLLIVGAGRTGCSLIEMLARLNYDITIIDKDKSKVNEITDRYNVNGFVGSGASKASLMAAGADTADILFALTPVDEINILSCMQAKKLGVLRCVARVSQPDFAAERESLKKEEHIDYILNPKYDMAEEAALSIGLPGFVKPEGVFGGYMQMITVTVLPDSPLAGKTLIDIRRDLEAEIIVGTVLREGKLYVPDGSFRLREGDRISVVSGIDGLIKNLRKIGIVKNPARKVIIYGGGTTAEYLIQMLLKKKKAVTVIEPQLERCRELSEKYPTVNVSYGEGEIVDILAEEGISSADAMVSLTSTDEINLSVSMYAWSLNVPSILTRIDSPKHLNLLHKVNLDITLSPSEISVDKLVRFIHNCEAGDAPNGIEKYYSIADNKAEVIQFTAGDDFAKPDVMFKEPSFKLRKNVLIASIIRDGELIIPGGNSTIHTGDKVIIVSDRKNHIVNLNEIFA